jgi:hypothetical protein
MPQLMRAAASAAYPCYRSSEDHRSAGLAAVPVDVTVPLGPYPLPSKLTPPGALPGLSRLQAEQMLSAQCRADLSLTAIELVTSTRNHITATGASTIALGTADMMLHHHEKAPAARVHTNAHPHGSRC